MAETQPATVAANRTIVEGSGTGAVIEPLLRTACAVVIPLLAVEGTIADGLSGIFSVLCTGRS